MMHPEVLALFEQRTDEARIQEVLLRHAAEINETNTEGSTALMLLAMEDYVLSINWLFNTDGFPEIDLNHINNYGNTALILACAHSKEHAALELLAIWNIDVTVVGELGRTALHWAAARGLVEVVNEILTNHRITPEYINHVTENGFTALDLAQQKNRETIVFELLSRPETIPRINGIAVSPQIYLQNKKAFRVLTRLLAMPTFVFTNQVDENGNTPLFVACHANQPTLALQLLAKPGIDITSVGSNGDTALTWAAYNGLTDVIRTLLTKDGITPEHINHRNGLGNSALALAVARNHQDSALLLLARPGIITTFIDHRRRETLLTHAARNGLTAVIRNLFTRPEITAEYINYVTREGKTALLLKYNSEVIVRQLLAFGNRIRADIADPHRNTALTLASHGSHYRVVTRILLFYVNHGLVMTRVELDRIEYEFISTRVYQTAPTCEICQTPFSYFGRGTRRHHCRGCAKAVCSNCSVVIHVNLPSSVHGDQRNSNPIVYCRDGCSDCITFAMNPRGVGHLKVLIQIATRRVLPAILITQELINFVEQRFIQALHTAPVTAFPGEIIIEGRPLSDYMFFLSQLSFFMRNPQFGIATTATPLQREVITRAIIRCIPATLQRTLFTITADDTIEDVLRENLVFFSDNEDIGLVVTDEYFSKFILGAWPNSNTEWANCLVFIRVNRAYQHPMLGFVNRGDYYNESPENLVDLFQRFPLFEREYALAGNDILKRFMRLFFENNPIVLPPILTAMNSTRSSSKLVGAENERILSQYIERYIISRVAAPNEELRTVQMTTTLTPAALEMIFRILNYPPTQERQRQMALFCLAFVFTVLSSTSMLGTSGDSPEPLRILAVALFNAITPNPIMTAEQILQWKRILLNVQDQFSCSGILSNTLNRTIIANIISTERDPAILDVLNGLIPPVWRECADYD